MHPRHQPLIAQTLASQHLLRAALRCSKSKRCRSLGGNLMVSCLFSNLSWSAAVPGRRRPVRASSSENRDPNSFGHPARRATDCLLLANAVCFVAQHLFNGKLVKWGIKDNAAIMAGQWWRLLTPAFLHGSLLHFFTNAYSLNNVGPLMERLAGTKRYLSVYAVSATGGCFLSYLYNPGYALGSSGAIFGILGSLAVFLVRHRRQLGPSVADSTLKNLVQVFAINLVIGMTPGIDNWGHLGGLIGGATAAYFLGPSWTLENKTMYDRPPIPLLAAKSRHAG